MADRDLLHKPMPLIAPEGEDNKRSSPAPQLGKLGVLERAREVAHEKDARPVQAKVPPQPRQPSAQPTAQPKSSLPTSGPAEAAVPAFRAAYFNRDVAATSAINQRSRGMAALRGQEGATDLKKVVLPCPPGTASPSPEKLHSALLRMAGDENTVWEFAHLLQRQADWTRKEGVTAAMIAALQQKLAEQIALRRLALARLRGLPPSHCDGAPSLAQALVADSDVVAQAPDPEAEAEALIDATARRGAGLLARLKKVMGSKL